MLKVKSVQDQTLKTLLQPGDLLTGYHSHPVKSEAELKHAIKLALIDGVETVQVVLLRQGQKLVVSIKPGSLDLTFDTSHEETQQPRDVWSLGISIGGQQAVTGADGLTASRDPQEASSIPLKRAASQHPIKRDITEHYKTARIIATIIMYGGWALVALGVVIILTTFASGYQFIGLMGLVVSVSPILGGLFQVLVAHLVLAVLDIADNTRATHHLLAQDVLNRRV